MGKYISINIEDTVDVSIDEIVSNLTWQEKKDLIQALSGNDDVLTIEAFKKFLIDISVQGSFFHATKTRLSDEHIKVLKRLVGE